MAGHSYSHATKVNSAILGCLLVLTVITVAAAGINFGSPSTNTVVAIVIASMKASLVALFFMHLRYDKPVNALIFTVGIVTLGIFLILTLFDNTTRPVIRPADLRPAAGGPQMADGEVIVTPVVGGAMEASESSGAAESTSEPATSAPSEGESTQH